MDKFAKLQSNLFLGFLVVSICVIVYYYNYDYNNDDDGDDADNIILTAEQKEDKEIILYHLKNELDKRSKKPVKFKGIVRSCLSGAFRGFLMGIILTGWEGAITSAVILGTINPIVSGIEHKL